MASKLITDEDKAERAETIKESVLLRAEALKRRVTPLALDEEGRRLEKAFAYLRRAGAPSLRPVLPLFLQLKGKPYSLTDYFPFEPFFRTRLPKAIMIKAGRQVAKSTSLAAQGLIFANSIPYFSTLYVTPLFEMVRRFSHNYVRDFLENSPIKRLMMGRRTVNSILQRSFLNGSSMFFSYAFVDADRVRGISADRCAIDEAQGMHYDLLEIVFETLSGSKWGLIQVTGTPKSAENVLERLWQDSSQAEWIIPCLTAGCGHWNIPHQDHDLLDMIGPYRPDISEQAPGVICTKCAKPLNPRKGRWLHAHRERRWKFAGYHVPQIIMPMHYADREKWGLLVDKKEGRSANMTMTGFLNEVCGESCDEGSKLVTLTDLQRAAVLPWPNKVDDAVQHLKGYRHLVLAVDWGGGGGYLQGVRQAGEQRRQRTSFTSMAVLGLRADDKIDCIWGHRSKRTNDYEYEARLCLEVIQRFRCSHLVHDYGGAGAAREVFVRQSGFPYANIIPIKYHGAASANLMSYHEATPDHPRDWYSVDKSYSLTVTCECVKKGLLRFFQDDYVSADNPGLLRDFLALIEEKMDSRLGTDVFAIMRNPNLSDDFAQAVNIGCCALWYMGNAWPDMAAAARMKLPRSVLRHVNPVREVDWDDL